jgi:hypothetical protein
MQFAEMNLIVAERFTLFYNKARRLCWQSCTNMCSYLHVESFKYFGVLVCILQLIRSCLACVNVPEFLSITEFTEM